MRIRRAVMTVTVILVIFEVVLRYSCGLGSPLLYAQDHDAGYVVAPSQDIRRFGTHIVVNEFSMRSPFVSSRRRPGTSRVMFVGDSVTFGPGWENESAIFPTLVPSLLDRRGNEWWESLNVSAPGWASGNEFGYLKSRGTFDANFVVLVLNTGDLIQPLARIDGSGGYPTKRPISAILELMERYVLPRVGMVARATDPGSTGDNSDRIPVDQVIANVAASRDLAARNGAYFLLVFVPAAGGRWEATHWALDKRSLDEWVNREQVSFVDMTHSLSDHPRSEIYFDGIHLRPLGHQLVAAAIADRLLSTPLRQ